MKIPVWFASIIVTAGLSFQGWLALEVIELRSDVAGIKAELNNKDTAQVSLLNPNQKSER
jgi:hypothetical protein